ncbi:ABC transporter permease [Mycoplasma marinum]|uniref:ABC transporter permease n=1 Tax=Mycoplasma marinum TaxID=1937190 RepID=UPI001FE7109F|nr:ABC transporter permease [Mycoplasma marinum]
MTKQVKNKQNPKEKTNIFHNIYSKYFLITRNKYMYPIYFLLKLIAEFLVISFLVITIVFFLIDSMPGENGLLKGLDDAQRQIVIVKYHLDYPSIKRFIMYIGNLIHGDFGVSSTLFPEKPINAFVWGRFGTSFVIGSISVILTLLIGIPLGIVVGKRPGKIVDSFATIIIAILISIPSMVLGLFMLLLAKSVSLPYIYDATNIASWFMPAISLSLVGSITYVRFIRTELNSELNSVHAKFAYLKGVSRNRFVWRHALKPSLFPIATFFPIVVLSSFIGSIFIEKIFQIPGSGAMFINAIQSKDQNIILFLVTIFSLLTIVSFILRDALYAIMDPRIRRR